ncbi:hypothetical protein ACFZAV_12150 [Streptomyces sp. NPDC008343]|uniref:hypothetical protein n=1 Tax=Streptomyces sp. NPDC008343 TaxID=3364828 RepID=UPI0036F04E24
MARLARRLRRDFDLVDGDAPPRPGPGGGVRGRLRPEAAPAEAGEALIRVATAANKIDAAEALSTRWLTLLQERADAGEQRFHRDIQGLSLHALANADVNLELQGGVLVGLEPGTVFLRVDAASLRSSRPGPRSHRHAQRAGLFSNTTSYWRN